MGYIDTMNIGGTDYDIKDKTAVDARPLIATVETTSTASKAYAKGEQFIYNNLLYKATAAISSGGTITPGSNCELAGDITSQIGSILQLKMKRVNLTITAEMVKSLQVPGVNRIYSATMVYNAQLYYTPAIVCVSEGSANTVIVKTAINDAPITGDFIVQILYD